MPDRAPPFDPDLSYNFVWGGLIPLSEIFSCFSIPLVFVVVESVSLFQTSDIQGRTTRKKKEKKEKKRKEKGRKKEKKRKRKRKKKKEKRKKKKEKRKRKKTGWGTTTFEFVVDFVR